MTTSMTDEEIRAAMFSGNVGVLQRKLPCKCCCAEHTSENCPARRWNGCRGSATETEDYDEWKRAFPSLPWEGS